MSEKVKNAARFCIVLLLSFFLGISMIFYTREICLGMASAILNCLTVIIPSLYGFMALSGFLIRTNFYIYLSAPFSFASRYIFRIKPELFSVFLISLFAGYPVGAKLLYELLEENKITQKEAETMLCFCYAGSPTFIAGLAGIKLFSSLKAGLLIYFSVILTNLAIAIFSAPLREKPQKIKSKTEIKLSAEILINSIESGAKALFQVCFMIVFFSIIIVIFENLGTISFISNILLEFTGVKNADIIVKSMLEISNISSLPANCFNYMPLIAGIFSFGGVCIILQIAAITKGKIHLGKFILTRIISAFISPIVCHILLKAFGEGVIPVSGMPHISLRSISPIPSIFLIIMTIMLLLQKRSNFKKI